MKIFSALAHPAGSVSSLGAGSGSTPDASFTSSHRVILLFLQLSVYASTCGFPLRSGTQRGDVTCDDAGPRYFSKSGGVRG